MWPNDDPHQLASIPMYARRAARAIDLVGPDEEPAPPPPRWWRRIARRLHPSPRPAAAASRDQP
jgi:hypothetical protein